MIHTARLHDVLRGDAPVHGRGVFVERLWPRGVAKADMEWEWLKDVAPTTGLRKWFAHDPSRWEEFRARYEEELEGGEGTSRSSCSSRTRTSPSCTAPRTATETAQSFSRNG